MSHVDDGALHAYLDGALDEYPAEVGRRVREHLDSCSECRERLEAERQVREDAAAMLALAAPEVEVPTLEDLRAYVQASQPEKTSMSVRLYRLGWAASVVLAVGTGWMLGNGQLPTTPARDAVMPTSAPAEADGGLLSPNDDLPELEPTLERQLESAPAARSEVVAEEFRADVQAVSPDPVADLRENVAFTDQPEEPGLANQASLDVVATNPAQDRLADLDAIAAPASPPQAVGDRAGAGGAVVGAVGRTSAAQQGGDKAPEPEAVPNQQVAQAADPDVRNEQAARRAGPAPVVAAGFAADAGVALGQRTRVAADDEVVGDEPLPLSIPGLTTLEVVQLREGTTFDGSRALQLLESGDTLEVIYLPEGSDPTSLPPVEDGESELAYQRAAEWLVLRAPVALTVLEELLQRIEAGR